MHIRRSTARNVTMTTRPAKLLQSARIVPCVQQGFLRHEKSLLLVIASTATNQHHNNTPVDKQPWTWQPDLGCPNDNCTPQTPAQNNKFRTSAMHCICILKETHTAEEVGNTSCAKKTCTNIITHIWQHSSRLGLWMYSTAGRTYYVVLNLLLVEADHSRLAVVLQPNGRSTIVVVRQMNCVCHLRAANFHTHGWQHL